MAEREYPFGWIDFSSEDSKLAAGIINALRERGAVDELGIGGIQSAFANIFFPGTSTIQKRAKYFFAVCYALRDVFETYDGKNFASQLYQVEKKYSEALCTLYKNASEEDKKGILGTRYFGSDKSWLRRPPSEIYWSGIKQFGFIAFDEDKRAVSLGEFIRILENSSVDDNGYIPQKGDDEDDCDRKHLNEKFWHWQLPQVENWKDDPRLDLTEDEKEFFRRQIKEKFNGSLLHLMLENGMPEKFEHLSSLPMSSELKKLWQLAKGFSEFIYPAQIYFNLLLKRKKSEDEWRKLQGSLQMRAENVDIDGIFEILPQASAAASLRRSKTKKFLEELKTLFLADVPDENALDELLTSREKFLKGPKRAKLCHREEYQNGGKPNPLSFRFPDACRLLRDIGAEDIKNV